MPKTEKDVCCAQILIVFDNDSSVTDSGIIKRLEEQVAFFQLHVDAVRIPLPLWRGIFFSLPAGLNYYTMIGVQSLMDASAANGERSHSS